MRNFKNDGMYFRLQVKALVTDFLQSTEECSPQGEGLKQADIFRTCGLGWVDQKNSTSS